MKTPQFSGSGTAFLCSTVAVLAAAGVYAAVSLPERSFDLNDRTNDYSGGRLALAYNEQLPQWLAIPGRSTTPVVRTIGIGSGSRLVRYRTLRDMRAVVDFHKAKLAWKNMDWLEINPPRTTGDHILISIGFAQLGGERIQVMVRDKVYVRQVEVTLTGERSVQTALNQ